MSARAAAAFRQSDPDFNTQFRRWQHESAIGEEPAPMRAWHAADLPPPPPMSRARRAAERAWSRIVGGRTS